MEILPTAAETGTAIIVRVAFDEGSLTGKFTKETVFPEGDFRRNYFAGDRLARTVERVDKMKADIESTGLTMPQASLKFVLAGKGVSAVIPGIRTVWQAEANTAVSDLADLNQDTLGALRKHRWLRAFWYAGK
jgi:aryl-alcohol dehydrogenase-like predicted oxidoreductase